MVSAATRPRRRVRKISFVVALVVAVCLLPVVSQGEPASAAELRGGFSLLRLDGAAYFAGAGAGAGVAAVNATPLASAVTMTQLGGAGGNTSAVVLGSPVVTSPVVLGQTIGGLAVPNPTLGLCTMLAWALCPIVNSISGALPGVAPDALLGMVRVFPQVLSVIASCGATAIGAGSALANPIAGIAIVPVLINGVHICVSSIATLLAQVVAWAVNEAMKKIMEGANEEIRAATVTVVDWFFSNVLSSDNTMEAPALSCSWARDRNSQNCNTTWFENQYTAMREIGLLLLAPLLLLTVLYALMRGSVFFLMRAFLIMLPVAVIGSVIMLAVAQELLNIADDLSNSILTWSGSGQAMKAKLDAALKLIDAKTVGLFTVLWMLGLIIAILVLAIELFIRQTGIFLTAMFMPIAFAALVFPPVVKWLKRGVEILFGLIFAKVFIVAAIGLGYAALTNGSFLNGPATAPGEVAFSTILAGAVIFLMAAWTPTRVLAISASSGANAQGRILNASNFWNGGEYFQRRVGNAARRIMGVANNVRPRAQNHGPRPSGAPARPGSYTPPP